MSQEQFRAQPRGGSGHGEEPAELGQVQAQANTQGVDDVLDDIDSVLETNAEDFVRNFVQKGGQ
ncbi:ubiquitin-like protein Pup [Brevibacterium sp. 5221]|uniref:Prokaryotic ubiquitin-like protein Pup n=1 Tax=Brevibacterium rongguiense TaxID=2695267 RepID=A0A6N9H5I9_9MICO|nr:ubiquitin-like protein Pup [Brevibacterium rongguiense]MYM18932.1 ubiquitin-like protein Pup [Brevibacterium rongguiense]